MTGGASFTVTNSPLSSKIDLPPEKGAKLKEALFPRRLQGIAPSCLVFWRGLKDIFKDIFS
jgi:hypothetical protein